MTSVRLIQFTDTHLYGSSDGALRGVATYPALLEAVAHARKHRWPCDGILATGDLVQDDPRGYARFREVFTQLGTPVYCIPGNHDVREAMLKELQGSPFQLGGLVRWPGWFGVMLDSTLTGHARGRLGGAGLDWLDGVLAEHTGSHGIVCLHHHPVSMNSAWLDEVGLEDAAEFLQVLDRHRNVRAVLWGHVHQIHEQVRNGVRFLSAPSTCAQFLPRSERFAIDHKPPGYRWLELNPDGSFETGVEWVAPGG